MLWMAAFGTWILSLVVRSLLRGLAIRISRFVGQSEDSWLTVGGQSVDNQWTAGREYRTISKQSAVSWQR